MKIIIFGNTNNAPLLLTCTLRTMGLNAHIVINRKEPLHRPENKYPSMKYNYPDWIHDYSYLRDENYFFKNKINKPLIKLLKSADALILNHLGPSLLPWVRRPAIAFLTGSDLDYYANYDSIDVITGSWKRIIKHSFWGHYNKWLWWLLIRRQRKGIQLCKAVSYFPRGVIPECDRLLDELNISDERRFHIYMGDIDDIKYQPPLNTSNKIRVFCGARLTWKKPILSGTSELDYKGIDVLLKGLKLYLEQGGTPIELHLVKKGLHITETINLARELGIDQHIMWLEEISLHDFKKELMHADICIDNLGQSMIGMSGVDAMAIGRPLLANSRPEVYSKLIKDPIPVCHASTPEQVCEQLQRLVPDFEERERIGRASRDYVIKHWSPIANANMCLNRLGIKYDQLTDQKKPTDNVLN